MQTAKSDLLIVGKIICSVSVFNIADSFLICADEYQNGIEGINHASDGFMGALMGFILESAAFKLESMGSKIESVQFRIESADAEMESADTKIEFLASRTAIYWTSAYPWRIVQYQFGVQLTKYKAIIKLTNQADPFTRFSRGKL